MTQHYKLFLVLVFLIIIFAEGIIQSMVEIRGRELPHIMQLFSQNPSRSNLRVFEKELEDNSYLSQTCEPVMRYLQFAVLKDTGDKAIMGRNGWFFFRPGANYLIEPWPPRNGSIPQNSDAVSAIVDFYNQLDARGIKLLIVPAPGKASVYPEKITARAGNNPTQISPHTKKVMDGIQSAGIEWVDLFALFNRSKNRETDLYLKQDTHWSTAGMRIAAKRVAERLLELGWIDRGGIEYELKPIEFSRYGDILRMINLPFSDRLYQPERLYCTQVIDSLSGTPNQNNEDSEILVLGDSFLRIYEQDEPGSAGFVSHLACELKTPVTSIINDGGASTLVRQELARKSHLLRDKKVVIWEFVERDIRFGMEGWQKVAITKL